MKSKQNNLWIIVGIVALNSIGFSIVLPLLPFLIGNYLPSGQIVFGMSSLMSVFALCSFFSAPIFGVLSDRYGRKSILLISLLGSVCGYVLFGIGGALWVLFAGRIIDGLTAGNISILLAYISDTTTPKERSKWFGYIGAAMGIGKIGGPALGGLLGSISLSLPFFITAGLIFLSGIALHFLLPESLSKEKRSKHLYLKSFNTFLQIQEIFRTKTVKKILIVGMLFYGALGIFQFNFTIYLKDIYFWTPAFIGGILTFVGVSEIFTRAILLPALLKRLNEKTIGIFGLTIFGIGLGLILTGIFIHSGVIVVLAVVFIISGEGLFDPTFNGMLSLQVNENQQGKLQGVNQSLQSLNNVIMPLVAAAIYSYSPSYLYALAVGIVIASIPLISVLWRKEENVMTD